MNLLVASKLVVILYNMLDHPRSGLNLLVLCIGGEFINKKEKKKPPLKHVERLENDLK